MKRTIVSLMLAAALFVPLTIAHSNPADAACGHPLWLDIITIGLDSLSCPYGTALPTCSLQQQPKVKVTDTDHVYDYSLACDGGYSIQVSGAYNVNTQEASEKLTGDAGNVEATWTCPADPWTAAAGHEPVCKNLNAMDSQETSLFDLSHSTLPFSVQLLNDQSRQTLATNLQAAIAQTPASPFHLVTNLTPSAGTCIACGAASSTPAQGATTGTGFSAQPTCLVCTQHDR